MRSLAERGVLVVAAAQVRDLPSLLNSHELNPLLGALHPVPILLPPSAAMGEAGRRSSGSGGVAAEVTVAGAGVGAGGSGAGRSAGAASTAGVGVGGEDAREGAGSAQVGSEGPLLGPPPRVRLERLTAPAFTVLVEVLGDNTWHVHPHVGRAVDQLLGSVKPATASHYSQMRRFDSSGRMLVMFEGCTPAS